MRWHVAALAALLLGWCGCWMPTTRAAPRDPLSPDETFASATSNDKDAEDDADQMLMEAPNRWNAPWMGPEAILAEDPADPPAGTGNYYPVAYQIGPDHFLFAKGRAKRQNGMGPVGSASGGPMLSINHNIDALRNRLWQEMQRRKTQKQIHMNKGYLEGIGKRRKRAAASAASQDSGLDAPTMDRL